MAKFKIQQASSTINWTGKKVLGLHTGTIKIADGFIEIIGDEIQSGIINVDMNSIHITDIEDKKTNQDFLQHLLNEDFFSVEKFRSATLTITSSKKLDHFKVKIDGILTIKDISHPISFNASLEILNDTLYSLGEIIVDRTLYNIQYGSGKFIDNLGDKLIYDDFILQFKLIGQKIN